MHKYLSNIFNVCMTGLRQYLWIYIFFFVFAFGLSDLDDNFTIVGVGWFPLNMNQLRVYRGVGLMRLLVVGEIFEQH